MSNYQMVYGHTSNDCTPGHLTMDATADSDAVSDLLDFVKGGYRNETWASVELSDGRSYVARNVRGGAVGQYNN